MNKQQIMGTIDYAILDYDLTEKAIVEGCRFAIEAGVHSVHVYPYHIPTVVKALAGSKVCPGGPVGFPHGAQQTRTKVTEVEGLVESGSREIDAVINVGALKDHRDEYVLEELEAIVKAARGREVKIIIQSPMLTDEEIIRAGEMAVKAGAQFIKTQGGLGHLRDKFRPLATLKILREAFGDRIGIKISDAGFLKPEGYRLPVECLEAGATRLGLGDYQVRVLLDKLV